MTNAMDTRAGTANITKGHGTDKSHADKSTATILAATDATTAAAAAAFSSALTVPSPVSSLGHTPVSSLGHTPVSSLGQIPVSSAGQTLVSPLGKTPTPTLGQAPVSSVVHTPVSTLGQTPVSLLGQAPVSSVRQAPASSLGNSPVSTLGQIPVSTLGHTPVSTLGQAPVSLLGHIPVSTLGQTPVSSPGHTSVSSLGQTLVSPQGQTPVSSLGHITGIPPFFTSALLMASQAMLDLQNRLADRASTLGSDEPAPHERHNGGSASALDDSSVASSTGACSVTSSTHLKEYLLRENSPCDAQFDKDLTASERRATGDEVSAATELGTKTDAPQKVNPLAREIPPCDPEGHAVLNVECGDNFAILHLSKLLKGSRSPSVLFKETWLTPNEFQLVSGRKTAKDWKRSMRHYGRSLKLLIAKKVIDLYAVDAEETKCRCDVCTGLPHDALKDIPAQRNGSPTPPKTLKPRVKKSPESDESSVKSETTSSSVQQMTGEALAAAATNLPATLGTLPGGTALVHPLGLNEALQLYGSRRASCGTGTDNGTASSTSSSTTSTSSASSTRSSAPEMRYGTDLGLDEDDDEEDETKTTSRTLLRMLMMDKYSGTDNIVVPGTGRVVRPIGLPETLPAQPERKPAAAAAAIQERRHSVSRSAAATTAASAILRTSATAASAMPVSDAKQKAPKRGRLLNSIIDNLRSCQQDHTRPVAQSCSVKPDVPAEDYTHDENDNHVDGVTKSELAVAHSTRVPARNAAGKRSSESSNNDGENKVQRTINAESVSEGSTSASHQLSPTTDQRSPAAAVASASAPVAAAQLSAASVWHNYWVWLLTRTAGVPTACVTTSSTVRSGRQRTETVYTEMLYSPRPSCAVCPTKCAVSEDEQRIMLHRVFAADYQRELKNTTPAPVCSMSRPPLDVHTNNCCPDIHCRTMRHYQYNDRSSVASPVSSDESSGVNSDFACGEDSGGGEQSRAGSCNVVDLTGQHVQQHLTRSVPVLNAQPLDLSAS